MGTRIRRREFIKGALSAVAADLEAKLKQWDKTTDHAEMYPIANVPKSKPRKKRGG